MAAARAAPGQRRQGPAVIAALYDRRIGQGVVVAETGEAARAEERRIALAVATDQAGARPARRRIRLERGDGEPRPFPRSSRRAPRTTAGRGRNRPRRRARTDPHSRRADRASSDTGETAVAHRPRAAPPRVVGYGSAMASAMLSAEACRGGRRRSGAARAAGRPGPTGSSLVCAGAAQRAVVLPLLGLDRLLAAPSSARSASACRNRDQGRRDRGPWRVLSRSGTGATGSSRRAACASTSVASLPSIRCSSSTMDWSPIAPARAPCGRPRSVCSVGAAGDEVVLGGMERHTAELGIEAARSQRRTVIVRAQRRAAHLDLAALRRSGGRLADALSRNSRHQLRRTRRLYSALGPLSLRAARTADEALAMLEQLKALHQRAGVGAASPAVSPPPPSRSSIAT